ncbi:lyase family protein [Georgenia sp. AZ-5]|uniref:lyase family protein n=1 Tax=Georgenia sp. AZ-5 TaxID=3367526 RepID=UPI003753EA51
MGSADRRPAGGLLTGSLRHAVTSGCRTSPGRPKLSGLFEALDGEESVDAAVSDRAFVRAMLDVEAALARALEGAGRAPGGTGAAVTEALEALDVDPGDLGRRAQGAGNPVVPLVEDAVAAVPEPHRSAVHLGATSQDVLDTAVMLVADHARERILAELARAADAAARLADEHRGTLMVARTLGQPALPTTFGAKVAGWLRGLHGAAGSLEGLELAVQLGGAAGTLAAYDGDGLRVMRLLAGELGLDDPGSPWHTERSRVRALAQALAGVVLAAGKVATDVALMSQAEVREVAEGAPGGSSAMPQKKNPVASVLLVASARRVPGLVAAVLGAGLHEHERATGSWHAEWVPVRDLARLAGGAAARVANLLEGLLVDPEAMRRNLDAAQPGVMAEAYAAPLIPAIGRAAAQEAARTAVEDATRTGEPLGDPATYLGSVDEMVDRALAGRRD